MDCTELVGKKLNETNEFIRHIFQLYVGWFTFFASVNYATMGWLASGAQDKPYPFKTLVIVSVLFVVQNALAIVACLLVRRHLAARRNEVLMLEEQLYAGCAQPIHSTLRVVSAAPFPLYERVVNVMTIAIVFLFCSWMVFPWLFWN